jgi:hypothetical protein
MSNVNISDLSSAGALAPSTDLMEVQQAAGNRKITVAALISMASGVVFPQRAMMFHRASAVLTGNAITFAFDNLQAFGHYAFQGSTYTNGDSFQQSFMLAAGTYNFRVLGYKDNAGAKIDWYVDGTLIASGQDWYNSSSTYNVEQSVTSVSITGSGRHLLKGVVNGKNSSSSNYRLILTQFNFDPTATETTSVT